MTRTLDHIPLKAIADTGENPRQSMDTAELKELTASIGEHGVLQPILVERDGQGYKIVAGHRRVAAAIEAGLTEIPAQIEENGQNRRAAALTENIIRADLTALEEAQALAQLREETGDGVRELARRIGKGKDWVSDRLRLAKLPQKVQERVAAGDVRLAAVPQLAKVADALGPEAASAALDIAQDFSWADKLEDGSRLGSIVASAVERGRIPGTIEVGGYYGTEVGVDRLGLDQTVAKELRTEFRKLGPDQHGRPRKFRFGPELAAAASKAGVVVELDGKKFVTDKAWIEKQARAQLAKMAKEPKAPKADKKNLDAEAAAVAKAKADKEAQQATIVAGNRELGKKLKEKFTTVDVTPELARLFVSFLIAPDFELANAVRLVDERLVDSEETPYGQVDPAEELLERDLAEAKTVEEIFAIGMRVLLAAAIAKNPHGYHYGGWLPTAVEDELGAIAKKVRIIPKALKADSK